jgi:hypothetical protein
MQTGQVIRKPAVIQFDGDNNAENPLTVTGEPLDALFRIDQDFGLYTQGTLTKRAYFGLLSPGTYQAYEFQTADGQRNVIVQRVY